MIKRLLWLSPWLIALLLLLWVWYSVSLTETMALLRQLGLSQIVALVAMNALVLLVLNGRWWLILRGLGYRLPYLTLTGYRVAAFGLSYFTPGPLIGGEPLQVYLLEQHHGVPRATAIAVMTVDKLLEWMVNVLFLLIGVAFILQQQLLQPALVSKIVTFSLFLSILPFAFLLAIWQRRYPISSFWQLGDHLSFLHTHPTYQKISKTIRESETVATDFCQQAPLALFSSLLISLLGLLALLAEYWFMLSCLGVELSISQLMAALAAARVALFLLIPGGLGAIEASQVLALSEMGFSPAVGVSISLLIRARDVILGAIGLWWGSKQVASAKRLLRDPEDSRALVLTDE